VSAHIEEIIMPSLIGNYVAANYRKQFAPFTRFGTRQLAFFQISMFDLSNDTLTDEEFSSNGDNNPYFHPEVESEYAASGYFQQAVMAVQQNVELYGVFRPGDGYQDSDGNSFIIMVGIDTANIGNEDPNNTNNFTQSIADAVYNTTGQNTDVYHMRIRGGSFRWTDLNGLEVTDKAQAAKSSAGPR
jgi:hypothetical protein